MIRVLVVDDSAICRELLCEQLEREGDISVVATASSGEQALEQLATLQPDVITLDIQMPGMGGLATIEAIMARHPRPILVVTGLDTRERDLAVAATRRGALALANKIAYDDLVGASQLRASVRRLAAIALEQPAADRGRPAGIEWPTPAASSELPIVAIGSSAGGPKALFELLDILPPELPACLAIANHLPVDFVSAFARLLETQHRFPVTLAFSPVTPEPGMIVLAPGGSDLALVDGELIGTPAARGSVWVPRIDTLLSSLARAPGAHVGVILSGLGNDGARGLADMRAQQKLTIVQDQASAAVWGMPRAALGSAVEVLAPADIATTIIQWLALRRRRRSV